MELLKNKSTAENITNYVYSKRNIVESEKITDNQADTLAFDISSKIQTEMTYPGQIKVTVIREKRAIAYAK